MKCNIGQTDRVLRMTVGITLMGLAGFGITGPWAWIGIGHSAFINRGLWLLRSL